MAFPHPSTARLLSPDYEPVPTLPELAARGLARAVAWTSKGAPTHHRPTLEGEAELRDAMRRNVARDEAWIARHRAARARADKRVP